MILPVGFDGFTKLLASLNPSRRSLPPRLVVNVSTPRSSSSLHRFWGPFRLKTRAKYSSPFRSTEMWVTIIIPCIPPLWPLFRQTFNVFSNKIPSRRKGTAQSSNNHIANSYLRPSDRHVAGTSAHARDFRRLGSQDNSEDDFMPPDDGILMTRNISINQKPTPTISSSASQT